MQLRRPQKPEVEVDTTAEEAPETDADEAEAADVIAAGAALGMKAKALVDPATFNLSMQQTHMIVVPELNRLQPLLDRE